MAGRRSIAVDTALRLAALFGTDTQIWINLQSHYDTEMARDALEETLSRIRRWDELSTV